MDDQAAMADESLSEGRCLLFTYGLLRPDFYPPSSMTEHHPDAARGELFDLGDYPAAVHVGRASTWIEGWVVNIAVDELEALDQYEGVDHGEYARIETTTRSGQKVWIYEYRRSVPPGARAIRRWPRSSADARESGDHEPAS